MGGTPKGIARWDAGPQIAVQPTAPQHGPSSKHPELKKQLASLINKPQGVGSLELLCYIMKIKIVFFFLTLLVDGLTWEVVKEPAEN